MGETLNLLFREREDGTYELQVKESWSGRTVSGSFIPPYTGKQFTILQKKLANLESNDDELRAIGYRLFLALCGSETPGVKRKDASEQSVQAVLRSVIQRTLRRRGTVALTLGFGPGCDEFVRYPWELLYNGDHFLIVSGIFTLSRALFRPDSPGGSELPVHPPMRILYIGSSPRDCPPLETERSFEAMEQALRPLIDAGQVFLDRLEPPTFDNLVRYFTLYGGVGLFDDNDTTVPCYVVHFDGHGAYGRLCPQEDCETVNLPDARKCIECETSLSRIKPQTYLGFCDERGMNRFIDTQSLRGLFVSSDLRLAVLSACETATLTKESKPRHSSHQTHQAHQQQTPQKAPQQQHVAADTTLAIALVTGQVPAVVAMPFSLQDDISPTFMFHFYEALADGRTLEEALSRARQALLPMQQRSWFIPVLYRHATEDDEGPSPLLAPRDEQQDHEHPLAHLGAKTNFVGRAQELRDLDELLVAIANGEQKTVGRLHLRPGTHHIALTGSAGIGKSALAFEAVRRNRDKFPGAILGISLQDGKTFSDALIEMVHQLHIPMRNVAATEVIQRVRSVQNTLRSLASRELPSLLLLDSFEEVKDRAELEKWLQFLCSLPPEVLVLVTSHSNPENMMIAGGPQCRWYECPIGKMAEADLLTLFKELAASSGLDQRIHLDDPYQQEILREICTLLDGYPLGAELIFGTAHSIGGRLYTPEAATRSLEEVRDELHYTPLAGILAVLQVSYLRLTPAARLLLSYLAAFKLPFSREQILMLVAPEAHEKHTGTSARSLNAQENGHATTHTRPDVPLVTTPEGDTLAELVANWRAARDELVQASFIQFDGRVYTIHPQVRHFALSYLPLEERRRVHRTVAAYYASLAQPGPQEWVATFEHLEAAGEAQDLQEAVRIAIRASWALDGRGHAQALQRMLRRAAVHASALGDRTGEGKIQCCLGAILRQLGNYAEAEACLRSSLEFHKQQNEHEEAGWAMYELAMLFREEGNLRLATTYAQEGLTLFREVGKPRGEAWIHLVQGEVSRGSGNYYEALGHFELALTSFQNLGDKEGRAWTLRDRGTIYATLGQSARALSDYEEALRIFNELGLRIAQAWVLTDKSAAFIDEGKFSEAEKLCYEAITLFREQGVRRGEAWVLRASGDLMYRRNNLSDAHEHYDEAISLFGTIGDRLDQARTYNSLAIVALAQGEALTAKDLHEQAQAIAHEQGARQIEESALHGLGNVEYILKHFAESARYYARAAALATELDLPAERCAIVRRQGQLAHAQGNCQDALEFWVQALSLDPHPERPAYRDCQQQVSALIAEQHLEATYQELAQRYGLLAN